MEGAGDTRFLGHWRGRSSRLVVAANSDLGDDEMTVDLKELVSLPYGEAEKRLREAGHWDATAESGGAKQRYRVYLQGTIDVSGWTIVEAASEDEAADLAEDEAKGAGFDWSDFGATDAWTTGVKPE